MTNYKWLKLVGNVMKSSNYTIKYGHEGRKTYSC